MLNMERGAIKVRGLSKRYRIGDGAPAYRTLRDTLAQSVSGPFNRFRGKDQLSQRGEHWALTGVSFDVPPGQVFGVIGRNGAGKSTLFKILSRITEPTEGEVAIRGRVSSLLEVGTGFHAELSGRENIYLNGAILGMRRKEIDRKFDDIVEFAGIEKFVETPVKRYSTGMYLRLAFAVSAHVQPDILIVDEVLAVGDAEFQKKCLGKMDDVAREGRTVLFVSHNMPVIQRLCHRAILLDQGRIVHDGPVQETVSHYLTLGMERMGERSWPDTDHAPGDDVARLCSVRAIDAGGKVSSSFSVRNDWRLVTEFRLREPGHRLNLNVYVYDETGALVFVTGDFQTDRWQNESRPVGIHRSICHIPGDFLNCGRHRVLVALVTPPATLRAMEEDALFIDVMENASPDGAHGHYAGPWPGGAVRPLFKWDYEFEPDAGPAEVVH